MGWGLGVRISGFGVWVPGLEIRFGFPDSFRVSGSGLWDSGFGFRSYRVILDSKGERRSERRRRDRERLLAGRLERGGCEDDRGAVAVDGKRRAGCDILHGHDCHLPYRGTSLMRQRLPPQDPRHRYTVGSYGVAFSCKVARDGEGGA